MKRLAPAFWVSIAITCSGPAFADSASQPAANVERAEDLFHRGTAAFEQGRFADAETALRAAWQLGPSYRTAAGLGQVELSVGEYRNAAEHLSYCIRHLPSDVDSGVRQHVEQGLADARDHVAALRIRVSVENADVTVDGSSVGKSPLDGLVFVDPGSHVVAASRADYSASTETVDAPLRATLDVELSPSPASPSGAVGAAPVEAPQSPDAAPASAGLSPAVWVLIFGGSLTAAALGTAIAFDLKASSDASDRDALVAELGGSKTACANPTAARASACSEVSAKNEESNSADRVAVAFAISTGVLAAATAVTTVLVWPHERATDRSAGIGVLAGPTRNGGAVVLEGRF